MTSSHYTSNMNYNLSIGLPPPRPAYKKRHRQVDSMRALTSPRGHPKTRWRGNAPPPVASPQLRAALDRVITLLCRFVIKKK